MVALLVILQPATVVAWVGKPQNQSDVACHAMDVAIDGSRQG
jgi:hypothetical protein